MLSRWRDAVASPGGQSKDATAISGGSQSLDAEENSDDQGTLSMVELGRGEGGAEFG